MTYPTSTSCPLTVVIPSHNRTDLLHRCLASVFRNAPAGTEVVVVDDGSPEGAVSAEAARWPTARCLRLAVQRGFCVAANTGIHAAQAPVVELLNDDTEVMANWAGAALAHFRDPELAAVAPLVLCPAEQGTGPVRIDSAGDRYYLGGVAGKRGHGAELGAEYLRPCRVFGASASSAFYRRSAVMKVGAFPESFDAYFEDVDLSFRLRQAGYHILFEPSSRVWHQQSSSYGQPRRRLLEQQSRNEERVFWRNIPTTDLPGALVRHLAVLAAKAWRRWGEGNLAPFLWGRLRVLSEVAELADYRRRLLDLAPDASVDDWQVERTYWGNGCAFSSPHGAPSIAQGLTPLDSC